ncbi:MAG TPA: NADH-quinone oxidoreductase subunit NuoE [Phycisphaerae bacterium]|nr:NADH-quinone oxidoreductase subunit NuoE [Phycisphaerae bacterium]
MNDSSFRACPVADPAREPSGDEVAALLDELNVTSAADLISVLQGVQERFGYLPPAAMDGASRRMRIPLSRIYGVVSFYAQFYTAPRGRHTVRCCRGTACHVKGAGRILDAVSRTLGIAEGQTTPDMLFYLETVACLGTCFLAPAMMIDNQYYGRLTPRRVESILQSYRPGSGRQADQTEGP